MEFPLFVSSTAIVCGVHVAKPCLYFFPLLSQSNTTDTFCLADSAGHSKVQHFYLNLQKYPVVPTEACT